MQGIGTASVKVSTEQLAAQAAEVRRYGNDMKKNFKLLSDTLDKTKNYWLGEAGEAHRKMYEEQKDAIDEMLRRLLEHPGDLEAIAGNYQQAESINVTTAQGLPDSIIE